VSRIPLARSVAARLTVTLVAFQPFALGAGDVAAVVTGSTPSE
jgi:hypothetical protein